MNGTVVKNQLIFDFASGILGPAKSLFASTYLELNSDASKIGNIFENMLGENLMDNENIHPKNLKYTDCLNSENRKSTSNVKDPVTSFFGNLNNLNYNHNSQNREELCRATPVKRRSANSAATSDQDPQDRN